MGHCITAIILKGDFDKNKAEGFDLFATDLGFDLNLFHINHYYSACWQHKLQLNDLLEIVDVDCGLFPTEIAIAEIMKIISGTDNPEFAVILTDYFGGAGYQCANVFKAHRNADKNANTINKVLRYLGVEAAKGMDEFDTVGLYAIRHSPDFLEKYTDLANEYGV
ncbi:hypothetical protein ACTHGU_22105 [Chitinophagaceae bacterium MMS25-I14]